MTTIALFDIDGTLLRAGGAGRAAVEIALDEVTGSASGTVTLESVDFAGRTDPWIVARALEHCGIPHDQSLVDAVLDRYLVHLPEALRRASAFRVLPGVPALLRTLTGNHGMTLGLGTGNIERAAYAKLAHAGLDDFFAFGGFGCDHIDRAALLQIGLDRGLAHHEVDAARVVVIGDTPHDVAAAVAIGAESVAVSTGWFTQDRLEGSGATMVVSDLRDPRVPDFLRAS